MNIGDSIAIAGFLTGMTWMIFFFVESVPVRVKTVKSFAALIACATPFWFVTVYFELI